MTGGTAVMTKDQQKENLKAFEALPSEIKAENGGRIALLHDGALVAIYNDSGDAYSIGVEKYGLGNFSIETFGETPKSLGYFTAHVNGIEMTA